MRATEAGRVRRGALAMLRPRRSWWGPHRTGGGGLGGGALRSSPSGAPALRTGAKSSLRGRSPVWSSRPSPACPEVLQVPEGRIKKIIYDRGFGFVRGDDGNEV